MGLKRFNARRKLKGAILTTMLATRSSLNLFRNRVRGLRCKRCFLLTTTVHSSCHKCIQYRRSFYCYSPLNDTTSGNHFENFFGVPVYKAKTGKKASLHLVIGGTISTVI